MLAGRLQRKNSTRCAACFCLNRTEKIRVLTTADSNFQSRCVRPLSAPLFPCSLSLSALAGMRERCSILFVFAFGGLAGCWRQLFFKTRSTGQTMAHRAPAAPEVSSAGARDPSEILPPTAFKPTRLWPLAFPPASPAPHCLLPGPSATSKRNSRQRLALYYPPAFLISGLEGRAAVSYSFVSPAHPAPPANLFFDASWRTSLTSIRLREFAFPNREKQRAIGQNRSVSHRISVSLPLQPVSYTKHIHIPYISHKEHIK